MQNYSRWYSIGDMQHKWSIDGIYIFINNQLYSICDAYKYKYKSLLQNEHGKLADKTNNDINRDLFSIRCLRHSKTIDFMSSIRVI